MDKLERRQKGINRARRIVKVYRTCNGTMTDYIYNEDEKWFKRAIHTRVPCSCYMCGNRRKTMGRTVQEMKADLELWEESKDLTV